MSALGGVNRKTKQKISYVITRTKGIVFWEPRFTQEQLILLLYQSIYRNEVTILFRTKCQLTEVYPKPMGLSRVTLSIVGP